MKSLLITCAVCALLFGVTQIGAEDMQDVLVEQTTESPIADMALVDSKDDMSMNQKLQVEAQPHTIADFIIHPLIALKPRQPDAELKVEGKQADTSTTTPSPWQLFGFNPGQNLGLGLGSSVSNLAGQVTGWLGNRIQLPGLVDTPVRESTSTSTSTTTTTTPRPDVVVRVQQRPSTRKPLIAINNENRPFRNKNPNRINNNLDDSEEYTDDDEYDDDFEDDNDNRDHDDDDSSNEDDDEDSDDDNEDHDDEEEEEEEVPVKQQNNNRRRRPRPMNNNNNNSNRGNYNNNNQRRRFPNNINNNQRKRNQNRRRPQQSEDIEQYDDDDVYDQGNYYNNNNNNNQKRSQNQQNFIQRGQQSLLNQIRQFTRGQTPAEIGNAMRKPQAGNNNKRRQQATLIINRNGQTIYAAPELLQAVEVSNNNVKPNTNTQQFQFYQPASVNNQQNRRPVSTYPQPPLTIPYRRKGQPTQYITIPWSQLGISPPDQIISLTDGIQSQPLILNIPQSAINAMQNQRPNKKKQLITSEAVPLLADASLMDIFKPPRIPPARTPAKVKPTKKPINSGTPVVIASKTKPGPQRIRPGTIVEKAPADDDTNEANMSLDSPSSETSQFIVVGEDGEAGFGRNAFPYYNSLVDYLQHNGGFRDGRQLNVDAETAKQQQGEKLIPVQVINAEETKVDNKVETVKSPVEVKLGSVESPVEAKVETIESSVEAKAETTEETKVEVAAETKVVDAKVETPVETKVVAADVAVSSNSE